MSNFVGYPLLVGVIALSACGTDPVESNSSVGTETGSETGDGDGDPASGDGDGDMPGDGDGDMPGDGDGDMPGDGDGDMPGDGDGDEPLPSGELRIFHGSPDAPAIDVYVDDEELPAIEGLAYGESSSFLSVPAADHNFQIYVAGEDPTPENLVIETDSIAIDVDARYTVLARGLLMPGPGSGELGLDVFVDDFGEVAADTVRARIVHVAADGPTVDLDIYEGGAEAPCEGDLEIEGLERFAETGEAGVELPAVDGLNLAVCLEGEALDTYTLDLEALSGSELYVFADGLTAQNIGREYDALQFFALDSQTVGPAISIRRDPLAYIMHAGPDLGVIDICVDGEPVAPLQDLAITNLVGPLRFRADEVVEMAIHTDPGGEECAGEGIPFPVDGTGLMRGTTSIAVVAGSLGLDTVGQELFVEGFDLSDADNLRLRLGHVSPDLAEVDAGLDGVDYGLFTDLDYGDSSEPEGASLMPDGITLQVGLSMAPGEDATDAVALFGELDLGGAAGRRYIGIVTGMYAPGMGEVPLLMRLVRTDAMGDYGWTSQGVLASLP